MRGKRRERRERKYIDGREKFMIVVSGTDEFNTFKHNNKVKLILLVLLQGELPSKCVCEWVYVCSG